MIEVRLHLPLDPGPDRLAALENTLNVLAEANAVWFGQNPNAPCCPACAGVRYYDPPVGKCQNFWGAPGMLRRGKASCADAAAYEVGQKLSQGHQASVVLEDLDGISMHAVAYVDGYRVDPSAELEGAPNRIMPRCFQQAANQRGMMAVGSQGCGCKGSCDKDFNVGRSRSRRAPGDVRGQRFARGGGRRRRPTQPRGCEGTEGKNWSITCCSPGDSYDPDNPANACVIYPASGNPGGTIPPPPHLANLPRFTGPPTKDQMRALAGQRYDPRSPSFAPPRGLAYPFPPYPPPLPSPPGFGLPPPTLPPPPVPPRPFEPGEPRSGAAKGALTRARRFIGRASKAGRKAGWKSCRDFCYAIHGNDAAAYSECYANCLPM